MKTVILQQRTKKLSEEEEEEDEIEESSRKEFKSNQNTEVNDKQPKVSYYYNIVFL